MPQECRMLCDHGHSAPLLVFFAALGATDARRPARGRWQTALFPVVPTERVALSQSAEYEVPVDRGHARSAVANAIVRLHAEHYGRGPTRARAHVAEDHVLVVLEDVF